MRIGVAAAPRWWGVAPIGLSAYLDHLVASGATAVELIVHHGSASRDPSTVHLDRKDWGPAVAEARHRGLHIDVHNSLDPRFHLDRWSTDRTGLQRDLLPVVDLLVEIDRHQPLPPAFVVHAADRTLDAESVTGRVLALLTSEFRRRACRAIVCVELRAGTGPDDHRFDRDRERLVRFVDRQCDPAVGMCWDIANDWLTARRSGRQLELPNAPPSCVRHIHVHDAAPGESLYVPLGDGDVPWRAGISMLATVGWVGSVTLEIRYRLAYEIGDPWTVLADSVGRALSVRT